MSSSLDLKRDLKGLLLLFLPIALISFSSYLFLFVEKLLLAQFSIQAMEAAINAAYANQIMQLPCLAIAAMCQVYVAQWHGAQNFKQIGPGVWQFIWFACLSMGLTVPFNFFFGTYYFANTDIETIVWPYFYLLTFINFLFPLGTALTCYNFGLGKMRLVLCVTVGSQILKLACSYLFIFGWGNLIPSLGLIGGALSTLIAQGTLCGFLLYAFINSKDFEKNHTRDWKFQPALLWNALKPGFIRAIGRIMMLLSWASITRLMTVKGGDYLLVLSIGGTLFIFLPFLSEAICQALITRFANCIGAKNIHMFKYAFQSGTLLVLLIALLLSIPLVMFPIPTYHYFFPGISLNSEAIRRVFFGVWTSFTFFAFASLPISCILAFKDTKFIMFMGFFNWINGYLVMYFAIEIFQMPAEQFWLVLTIMHGSMALLYYWRMKWLEARFATQQIA